MGMNGAQKWRGLQKPIVMNLRETVRPEALRNHDASDEEGAKEQELKSNAPRGKRARWILLFASALAVTAAILWLAQLFLNYESTDDARLRGIWTW